MAANGVSAHVQDRDLALATHHARRAVGRAGLTTSDVEDVAQEALVQLVHRLPRFDEERGPRTAYSAMVIRGAVSRTVEHRRAARRDWRRCRTSLDEEFALRGGNTVTRGETIASDEHATRTRGARLGPVERADLRLDLQDLLDRLPEGPRQVCRLLMRVTPTEAAREVGLPRGTFHGVVRRIRKHFEEAGLDVYVGTAAGGGR